MTAELTRLPQPQFMSSNMGFYQSIGKWRNALWLRNSNREPASHIGIIGPTAAFRCHPCDILSRILDVTGFAMDAILRIDHQVWIGFGISIRINNLIDPGWAIQAGGFSIKHIIALDRLSGIGQL